MDKTELVAPCGVYCGICPVYIADKEQNAGLKKKIAATFNVKLQDVTCGGCRSGRVFLGDEDCTVKPCAAVRGIEGCFRCNEFPCSHIKERPEIVRRVILRSVPVLREYEVERFIEREAEHYRCPHCGARLFMGARKCPSCGRVIDLDAG